MAMNRMMDQINSVTEGEAKQAESQQLSPDSPITKLQNLLQQKADILLDIFEAYHDAERKARGVLRANLIYVTAPTREQEEKIKAFLCKTYHVKSAELSMKEDKSLIGGFILQAENREFDWSLRGRFQSLSQALKH